mmetsp:Transcript_206/g.432  ORF Transcript_206/g.432 Transcript_206/m.432 type:complete len:250 (+) Transcript_206:136-885(+)
MSLRPASALGEENGDPGCGREQNIFIARYGLPETPLIEYEGPFDMSLSGDGEKAAKELGQHLKDTATVKHIFCSPFRRSLQTAIIASKVMEVSKVQVENGLTEWQTESLIGKEDPYKPPGIIDLVEEFGGVVNTKYESIAEPKPFESEEEMIARTGRVAKILAESVYPADILIISHAPCLLGISLTLEGTFFNRGGTQLKPWPLGGLTRFRRVSRDKESAWRMEVSGSTAHMSGIYQDGKQAWTLPCLQ